MKCDKKKLLVYAMFIILAIFGILFLINYDSMNEKKKEKKSTTYLIEGNSNKKFDTMDDVKDYLSKGARASHSLVKRKHAIMKSRGQHAVAYGTAANAAVGFPEFESKVEGFKEGAAGYTTKEKTDVTIGDTCATLDEDGTCLSEKNKKCKSLDNDFLKGDPNVCKKLAEDEYKFCGICVKPDQGLAVSAPGSSKGGLDSVPITCIPEKNWISPGKNIVKECEKALERIKCSKVKKCDLSDVGDAKNLCAWCPLEGKAFVYNKTHKSNWEKNNSHRTNIKLDNGKTISQRGEYVPKYPNLDECDWGNINGKPAWLGWGKKKGFSGPLIRGLNDCKRLNDDFPCLKDPRKIKTGKHTKECKQDMWESTPLCNGDYQSRIDNLKKSKLKYFEKNKEINANKIESSIDTYGMSYLDIFKEMVNNSKKSKSLEYDEANFHNQLCLGKELDSCDDKYKDSNRIISGKSAPKYRPKQCIDKLWKESGCGNGRYHPDNIKKFHDEKKLRGNNDYDYVMHKLPSSKLNQAFKQIKKWADGLNTNINENILKNSPGYTDDAIFWQEACYGKVLPKTRQLIKSNKPKCFKDFQHRIGNAHDVKKPEDKLNFYNDKQIKRRYINDSYMSNDNVKRAIMHNKSPIGRDWGSKKEVSKKMYDQEFFPYWKFEKASRDNYRKPTWNKFKLLLAGDGKTFDDFVKDEVRKKTPIELRNKQALANYNAYKIWGINGVSSPDPDTIKMDKLTDFTSIMTAYKINPTWKLSRVVNGKCQSCSLVPCRQCQSGCPRSECPDGSSRNHCPRNNYGKKPTRCDIPEGNIITKDMYANGYIDGGERKEFPYWEFIKIARRMGQQPFK